MEQEIENVDSSNGGSIETETEATPTKTVDVAKLQEKTAELEQTNKQLFERAKKAEGFVKVDGKWVKAPKPEEAVETAQQLKAKTGELDGAILDFFELKGYEDPDQVDVFTGIMKRTGMSHREVIKDEYALAKVKVIAEKKAVQNATPSNTKRAGGHVGDVASAVAKFKETGILPEDRQLADAVVDSIAKANNDRLPHWQR